MRIMKIISGIEIDCSEVFESCFCLKTKIISVLDVFHNWWLFFVVFLIDEEIKVVCLRQEEVDVNIFYVEY